LSAGGKAVRLRRGSFVNEPKLVVNNRICSNCIEDLYLSKMVERVGARARCDYCNSKRRTISIGELADQIGKAFEEHYIRTPSDASDLEYFMMKETDYQWERRGEPVVYAIMNAASIPESAAEHVREVLGERNHDMDRVESEFADESYYEEAGIDAHELWEDWAAFQKSLRTETRLFNRAASRLLDSIFEGVDAHTTHRGKKVIVSAGPNTSIANLYRARVFQSDEKLKGAIERPDLELGSPPYAAAAAGRMNAKGISVFYGATAATVALAETRPPVGSRVLVGQFEMLRPLRLLDVEAFQSIFVEGSIFDPEFLGRLKKAKFLAGLSSRITRPVMPDDEPFDYLVTQAIADYLASREVPGIDGIIYPSVQGGSNRRNVVLFHKAARVELLNLPPGTEISGDLYAYDDEGGRAEYTVIEEVPKRRKSATRVVVTTDDSRVVSLRVAVDSLRVHEINGVSYKEHSLPVSRHRWVKTKPEF
jgi:hypothetical protein